MRVLFSWLKELTEISVNPGTLAGRFTLGGCEVAALTPVDGDWVFEIEVTPNRPDLLSHLGMAREAAALLGRDFRFPRRLKKEMASISGEPPSVPVTLEDPEGCRRYCGMVIEGVKVRPSPPELAERLTRLGIRPVNNVVDATNLCLLELGQPLHAFDLDKLQGPSIQVRRAREGETLVTIDGTSCPLKPEALVIADARQPVAVAGVMGGRSTEISFSTKRLFLESAWFDPVRIRRAARITRLTSESSYRFERGVDPAFVPAAALRAARLIARLAGGKISGGLIDVGDRRRERVQMSLKPERASEILGMPMTPAQQRRFLQRLGCRISVAARSWRVEAPSWRRDLKITEDLYEELARLFGYERCLPTLPPLPRQRVAPARLPVEDPWIHREMQIHQSLAAAGLQEIMTYTLLGQSLLARCRLWPDLGLMPRHLINPLSMEQANLRPSLLPGMLEVVARNLNRKSAEAFRLFELGHIYEPWSPTQKSGTPPVPPDRTVPYEKRALSILMGGTPTPAWGASREPLGIFHLKGTVRSLLEKLRIGPVEDRIVRKKEGPAIEVILKGKCLGWIGQIDPEIIAAYGIPPEMTVVYAELDLEQIAAVPPAPIQVQSLPKIPPVVRDLAIVVSRKTTHEEILKSLLEAGKPLLRKADLFDLYRGKQVPPGKKSLAFHLAYSAGDRTLTEEEITACHQRIIGRLSESFQATLR